MSFSILREKSKNLFLVFFAILFFVLGFGVTKQNAPIAQAVIGASCSFDTQCGICEKCSGLIGGTCYATPSFYASFTCAATGGASGVWYDYCDGNNKETYTELCESDFFGNHYCNHKWGSTTLCSGATPSCCQIGTPPFSGAECKASCVTCNLNPTVTISPASQSGVSGAGTTLTYTVDVKNNDPAGCSNTTFSLTKAGCPGGWTKCNLGSASLNVAPQGSVSTFLEMQPSGSPAAGNYVVTITATGAASNNGTATATYVITPAGACPPGFLVSFNGGGYNVGDQLFINYTIPGGKNGCVAIYTPSNVEDWSRDDGPGPYLNVGSAFATSAGLWKVALSEGIGSCSSASTCSATMNVGAAGCVAGTCNGIQYCPFAGGLWQNCPVAGEVCQGGICAPVGPPNVHIDTCGGNCNSVGTGPCKNMIDNNLWTAASAPTTPAMCSADTNISTICSAEIAGGFNGCQINLSNLYTCVCSGGGGPGVEVCDNNVDDSDPDVLVDCADVADCPDGTSCFGGGTCNAGICVGGGGGGSDCDNKVWFFCNPLRGTIEDIFEAGETLIGYILGIIGSVALLLIIIAGVMYMTSVGNEEKITKSKKIVTGAIIGLAIALLSYSLLQLIISIL